MKKGNIQPQSKLISITQNGNLNGDPHFVLVNDVDDDISVRPKFSFLSLLTMLLGQNVSERSRANSPFFLIGEIFFMTNATATQQRKTGGREEEESENLSHKTYLHKIH